VRSSESVVALVACSIAFFFFSRTAPPEIYTLSLHDALPIWARGAGHVEAHREVAVRCRREGDRIAPDVTAGRHGDPGAAVEGQGPDGAGADRGAAAVAEGDRAAPDLQRLGAELVLDAHPQGLAALAQTGDRPHRLVVERGRCEPLLGVG